MDYDLIIIGGGINGAALARLAAFQGLRTALFEIGDFGRGASTNTSKLLHGGLRYLETFDFGLVRDAVRERAQLLSLAPHLVEARRFLFPRTRLGRHGRPGIKAGLTLYDFLAGDRKLDPHRWVAPGELRRKEPEFLPEEACGAYEYSDCVMDDARIVLENLVDAASLGADLRNYQGFQAVERAGNGLLEVTVMDRLTGRETVHLGRRLALCLGPWTDQVVKGAFPRSRPQVRLSQGIHLIAAGLPSQSCFILPVPGSKRYFFIVPWKGQHLIGTTETEVGLYPPEPAIPRDGEVEELLRLARAYFPAWKPDVLCTITGLRPLARSAEGSTITLSREHEFHRLQDGVFSAVGGKYTTHRTFAEAFLKFILGGKAPVKDIKTRALPGAWADGPERERIRAALKAHGFADEAVAAAWMRRYGKRSLELAEYVAASPARRERLPGPYGLLQGEIEFSAEREWARTAEDFFRRRTDAYFTRGAGTENLARVEAVMTARSPNLAKCLGPDADYLGFLKLNRHVAVGEAVAAAVAAKEAS
ncbi:MAG TPA: glycerol-3-phosphate dehydrogenase/oxidase [Fibrobacteria bacterium]|nr:glycerol-3-phosphate dehydrogenase/oxidase [Fibrobacteria bacterium]